MPLRRQPAHSAALLARWQALGHTLGRNTPAWRREGRRLILAWSQRPRAYHDTTHLWACLRQLDAVQTAQPCALQDPAAVELALWFHDAVYVPWQHQNEARSAAWASDFLTAQGLAPALVDAVAQLVLATRHHAGALTGDAAWVVDIDLAILGQSDAVYRRFERNVRREYAFVRWPRYVAGRSAVLRSFLDRPRIYTTDAFHARCEDVARRNLTQALAQLAQGRPPGE